MKKDIIGIDISDSSIEAVVLDKKGNNFVIKAYSRFRLSPDIVEDGKIIDSDKLKEALQKLFTNAKPHALKPQKVFLSIPESKTFTRVLSLSKDVKKKEIPEAIRHKAEESIPEANERLIPSVKILETNKDYTDILYTAAEVEIVNSLVDLFNSMNIEVVGITTESISSFHGLANELKNKVTLLLDLGSRTTIASIFDKSGIRDSININIAGHNITKALAAKLDISYTQAEDQKIKNGLNSSIADGEIMLVIQGQLQPLTDELKRFIKYYEDRYEYKIEQVVLIGGSAQIKGIDKYFGDNLNLEVHLGQPCLDNKFIPPDMTITKYINVLGLAKLAYTKAEINFYTNKRSVNIDQVSKEEPATKHFNFNIKAIIKNIYFLIFLGLLILAGLFLIFKQPLLESFETKDYSFTKDFQVVVGERQGVADTIVASNFDIVVEKTEALPGFSYIDAAKVIAELSKEINYDELNTKNEDTDLYILPSIANSTLIDLTPKTEQFTTGTPLTIKIGHTLMAVSANKVRNLIVQDLPTAEQQTLVDLPITSINYEILEQVKSRDGKSDVFVLRADLKLGYETDNQGNLGTFLKKCYNSIKENINLIIKSFK